MKKTILFISTLIFCICLSSCAALCNHTWNNATCTNAKTCTNCHSTEGEPLGHIWNNATCTTPKTCSICSTTEGSPIGHVWNDATCTTPRSCNICGITEGNTISHIWRDATCTEPFTCISCNRTAGSPLGHTWDGKQSCTQVNKCTICGITDGNVSGHKWSDATCTKAKTCSTCGKTEGTPIGHSWREATCTKAKTCTMCGRIDGSSLGHTWNEATCTESKICYVCGETDLGAIGHTWSNATCIKEPTCTEDGLNSFTCIICGDTKTENIKVSVHTPNANMRCTQCGVKCTADGKEVQVVWYGEGVYRVGIDIPAGDYYVVVANNDSGYWCVYQDSRLQKIIKNDSFDTFTFIRVETGQYLKLSRCKISDIENTPVPPIYNGNTYYDGTYRVGIDIPAGEYKFVTSTNSSGYYCAYTDITYEDIVYNEIFNNNAYYTVENGQILEVHRADFFIVEPAGTGNREVVYYAGFNGVPDFGKMYHAEPFVDKGNSFQYFESDVGKATMESYIKLLEAEGFVFNDSFFILTSHNRIYINNNRGLKVTVGSNDSPLGTMITIKIDFLA